MALVNIRYVHSAEPSAEGGEIRRTSIKAMEDYMNCLVLDMKMAGVSTEFVSENLDGAKNDVIVNGLTVVQILDGLNIVKPELDEEDRPKRFVQFERAPDDWNKDIVEDIPDILMKNALSKAYAEANKLRIKELL